MGTMNIKFHGKDILVDYTYHPKYEDPYRIDPPEDEHVEAQSVFIVIVTKNGHYLATSSKEIVKADNILLFGEFREEIEQEILERIHDMQVEE
jgi:hypothetical protein